MAVIEKALKDDDCSVHVNENEENAPIEVSEAQ